MSCPSKSGITSRLRFPPLFNRLSIYQWFIHLQESKGILLSLLNGWVSLAANPELDVFFWEKNSMCICIILGELPPRIQQHYEWWLLHPRHSLIKWMVGSVIDLHHPDMCIRLGLKWRRLCVCQKQSTHMRTLCSLWWPRTWRWWAFISWHTLSIQWTKLNVFSPKQYSEVSTVSVEEMELWETQEFGS